MSSIGSRLFNLIADKYLTLANEEFARTLAIGTDWNKIRLGVLLAVTPDGTNNLASSALVLGVSSGKTNPYGAASTTNFVGGAFHGAGGTPTATLTYAANSGNPYYSSAGTGPFARVGTTLSNGTGNAVAFLIAANNGSIQRRSPLYVDIQKGSPNFTVIRWTPQTSQSQFLTADCSPAEFLASLELATPTWGGISLTTSNSTVAASEAPGTLDTFDFFWNKSLFALEVYALAAYRMS
jgi:hypothetical protein